MACRLAALLVSALLLCVASMPLDVVEPQLTALPVASPLVELTHEEPHDAVHEAPHGSMMHDASHGSKHASSTSAMHTESHGSKHGASHAESHVDSHGASHSASHRSSHGVMHGAMLEQSPQVQSSPLTEPLVLPTADAASMVEPSAEPLLPAPPTLNITDFPKPSVRPASPSAVPSTVVRSTPLALSAGAACLPAAALVHVLGRGEVPISQVQLGDMLKVHGGAYSPVLLLTHYDPHAASLMAVLETGAGSTLTLSRGHYVPVAGRGLVAAGVVRVGDTLACGRRITAVRHVVARGLYNAQTAAGTLLVRGYVVSAYTDAFPPFAAHAALAVLRALHRASGLTVPLLSRIFAPATLPPAHGTPLMPHSHSWSSAAQPLRYAATS